MVLMHGKTKHDACLFRTGQLTTHNPMRGAVDLYRSNGQEWIRVASWNNALCEYRDNEGRVFIVEGQIHE